MEYNFPGRGKLIAILRYNALNTHSFEINFKGLVFFLQSNSCNKKVIPRTCISLSSSSIYFIFFLSLPASLNIQPCSQFFIEHLKNMLRKQLIKSSDSVIYISTYCIILMCTVLIPARHINWHSDQIILNVHSFSFVRHCAKGQT